MIHTLNLDPKTIPTLMDAKPDDMTLLEFETMILAHWAIRWNGASPVGQKWMVDTMRISLGR